MKLEDALAVKERFDKNHRDVWLSTFICPSKDWMIKDFVNLCSDIDRLEEDLHENKLIHKFALLHPDIMDYDIYAVEYGKLDLDLGMIVYYTLAAYIKKKNLDIEL